MLKLELDWAGGETPQLGTVSEPGESVLVVELAAERGPAGWPVVRVLAADGPALWAWLVDAYGVDGDEASELAGLAVVV